MFSLCSKNPPWSISEAAAPDRKIHASVAAWRACPPLGSLAHSIPGKQFGDPGVPFFHAVALLRHVVPAVIALGANVLQGVVLQPVADLLGDARLAGQGLPGA